MGPWAPSLGQTHRGQAAEPQVQGMLQPVGVVGLHLSPEALGAAGGSGDVRQRGLCADLVWTGRPALEGEGAVRQGLIPLEEGVATAGCGGRP